MSAILRAAAAYVISIFAVRFAMRALNAYVLAPQIGTIGAAICLLLATLLVAGLASLLFMRLFDVAAFSGPRLTVGLIALLLLMAAETRLSMNAGMSLGQHFAGFRTPEGLIDVVALLAVALFPTMLIAFRRKPSL
jgi:hypothetical protein